MSQDKSKIHAAVRDHYSAIAQKADEPVLVASSCCESAQATTSCCEPKFYHDALLEDLPVDVTGLSLGCGDPVTIASLKPGETVLDLGSGGGIDCFIAAKQVGESGHVIGVDMTPEMLAKANANKAKLEAQNVEFRLGQIENLPVDGNSIDVIMSNCVINLSPDKLAVFREAFRALKPGGRVSISDIVTQGEFSPALREQMDLWASCIAGAIDMEAYTALMREAGFVNIEVQDKVQLFEPGANAADVPRIFSARITGYKPAAN